jgi:hypothetical protein
MRNARGLAHRHLKKNENAEGDLMAASQDFDPTVAADDPHGDLHLHGNLREFVYALTFVSGSDQKPITLGVTTDLARGDIFLGEIMVGAPIASIPVAVAYNPFLDALSRASLAEP